MQHQRNNKISVLGWVFPWVSKDKTNKQHGEYCCDCMAWLYLSIYFCVHIGPSPETGGGRDLSLGTGTTNLQGPSLDQGGIVILLCSFQTMWWFIKVEFADTIIKKCLQLSIGILGLISKGLFCQHDMQEYVTGMRSDTCGVDCPTHDEIAGKGQWMDLHLLICHALCLALVQF